MPRKIIVGSYGSYMYRFLFFKEVAKLVSRVAGSFYILLKFEYEMSPIGSCVET
jgi:hypothetical protein